MKKYICLTLCFLFVSFNSFAFQNKNIDIILKNLEKRTAANWDSNNPVWFEGKIDRIDQNTHEIVIDDFPYKISKLTKYYGQDGKPLSAYFFKSGKKVIAVLGQNRKTLDILIIQ